MQKDKGALTKALNDLVIAWPSIFGSDVNYDRILRNIQEQLEKKREKLLHDRFVDYSIPELDQLQEMVFKRTKRGAPDEKEDKVYHKPKKKVTRRRREATS